MFSKSFLKFVQMCLFIRCGFPNTRKPNVFLITFRDQSSMDVMNFFFVMNRVHLSEHVSPMEVSWVW